MRSVIDAKSHRKFLWISQGKSYFSTKNDKGDQMLSDFSSGLTCNGKVTCAVSCSMGCLWIIAKIFVTIERIKFGSSLLGLKCFFFYFEPENL
jgi:coenzyme F420-reducing hydrogenase gamma subunit